MPTITEGIPEPEPPLTPTGPSGMYPALASYPLLPEPETAPASPEACVALHNDKENEADVNRPQFATKTSSENPFGEDDDQYQKHMGAGKAALEKPRRGGNGRGSGEKSENQWSGGLHTSRDQPTDAFDTGGRGHFRNRRSSRYLPMPESKGQQLFRSTLICNMVSFFASAAFLWMQTNVSLIPEPLIDLFLPMVRFMADTERPTHFGPEHFHDFRKMPHVVSFYMKYLDIKVNPTLPFIVGFLISIAGVHAMRGSIRCLRIYKAATGLCSIISLTAMIFTIYMWSMLPVIKEILPRCDAQRFCRPPLDDLKWKSSVSGKEIMTDCILSKPTLEIRDPLPSECRWASDFFLRSCKKIEIPMSSSPSSSFSEASFLGRGEGNGRDAWSSASKPLDDGHTTLLPMDTSGGRHHDSVSFFHFNVINDAFASHISIEEKEPGVEDAFVAEEVDENTDKEAHVDGQPVARSIHIGKGGKRVTDKWEQLNLQQQRILTHEAHEESECTINWPVLVYFHQYLDNFGVHLFDATTALWTLVLIFALNMITAYACFISAANFGNERVIIPVFSSWRHREARSLQSRIDTHPAVVAAISGADASANGNGKL